MSKRTEGKKLMPRLRFPEFRDAGPWEAKRLGEVCDVLQGYGFPERLQGKKHGKYPFCKVSDITNAVSNAGGHIREALNYIDDEDVEELRAKPIPKGVTIFAKIGEALRLNKRAFVETECLIDNNVVGLKGRNDQAIDYFVFYLSQKIDLNRHCGGAVPSVNKSTLQAIKICVPALQEQQKIADCLSSLDEVIELEAKKLEALKAHKKGLMQQLFPREGETVPRLRFPEFRDAGPWEVKRLGEVIELAYGAALPESRRRVGTIPVLGSNGIVGYHNEPLTRGPTIVIGRKGSAGEVVWVEEDCFPIDTTFYVQFRSPRDDPRFVYFLLVMLNLPELARAEGVPGLNRNDVYSIKVGIPRSEEQQKIADCLSSLDEVIALEAQRLDALKAHKKGLMQRLFPQEEV